MTREELVQKAAGRISEELALGNLSIECTEAGRRLFMHGAKLGALKGIDWSDKNPPEIVKDFVGVLEVVKDRHEKFGGDARKHGIPFGIYTICCNVLDKYKKGS